MISSVLLFNFYQFLPGDALVHSAVLKLHVVRLSVRLSVCDVGGCCVDKTVT